jgi:hypothetical protein
VIDQGIRYGKIIKSIEVTIGRPELADAMLTA